LVSILEANGPDCTQELIRTSLSSDCPEIRSGVADVLGRLNDPQVFPALITLLGDKERRVRWKALNSFGRRADAGPLPEEARTALFQHAGSELAAYRQNLLCSQALLSNPLTAPERLLSVALQEDRVKIVERLFHILGILCGREQMLAIFEKLHSGDARLRSDALEALDTLVPHPIGRQVLGLLEPAPTATQEESVPAGFSVSEATLRSKPWLRACMTYYLGQHPGAEGRALLKCLLADPSEVVRETALYAGWQAFHDEWRQEIDAQVGSSDALIRRCAQRILAEATDNKENISGGSTAMLLTVEKVLLLKSANLFAGLESEELAALAEIALEKEFPAGEIVFEEGQPGVYLYILVHGKIEVFHRVNSDEYSIATLGEKECFGEMAILNDEPRSASVRALEPTQVLKIDRNSFRELITERPEISFAIFKILSDRLKQKNLENEQASALDTARHYA
jgi:HEAT repeat protein